MKIRIILEGEVTPTQAETIRTAVKTANETWGLEGEIEINETIETVE